MKGRIVKFFLIFCLIFALAFPRPTYAFIDALSRLISNFLIANIIRLILAISRFALEVATDILEWVLSENFISYSYTDPARNPFIKVGWTLMRDLVNMFFIIALAFIGLATALKLQEYNVQKALPKLIIIALIINFTPVICGLIVDATNIITYFFVEQTTGLELLRAQYVSQTAVLQGTQIRGWFDWESSLRSVVQAFMMAGANIISALILLVFAVLFAARYVAIWIAVIMSPLAFFSYIFPRLKLIGGFWNKWWDLFLQWCFIGITAGFFLYLGNHIMLAAPEMIQAPAPSEATVGANFLEAVLPFGIAVGFLFFGLMQAISGAAMGASYAISGAQAAVGLAVGATGAIARKGTGLVREKAPEPVKEAFSAMAKLRTPLQTTEAERARGIAGWVTRTPKAIVRGAVLGPAAAGIRAVGRTFEPEARMRDLEKAEKEVTNIKTPEDAKEYFEKASREEQRIALLHKVQKEGWAKKAGIKDKDVVAAAMAALEISPEAFKPIMKAYPGLTGRMIKLARAKTLEKLELDNKSLEKFAEENAKALEGIEIPGIENLDQRIEKLIALKTSSGLTPKDLENISLKDIDKDAIHAFWGGNQISAAARQFGREFVDEFMKDAEERGLDSYLQKGNFGVPQYLTGNAAQDLGFRPLEGIERGELRERIKVVRAAAPAAEPVSEIDQLRQELKIIESGPKWRKTITPEQMRERRRIRTRINEVQKEQKIQKRQEIKITKLYNKIPSVPDKEYQKAFALEEILGFSKLPRRFETDESKRGQPGPVIEIGKKAINVHPDFLDEAGQIFDESKPEQERKQILGSMVRRVRSEKQKQTKEKRTAQIKAVKTKVGTTTTAAKRKIGRTIRRAKRGARRKEVNEEIIKELEDIADKFEELAKLPPVELAEREAELEELEKRREEIERKLVGNR